MEIYKGTATFPGIAIGRLLIYQRAEYQIRQYLVSNVKKELDDFSSARIRVKEQLEALYEQYQGIQEAEARTFLNQSKLLNPGSFQRAVESMIVSEKVNASYAVMTTRDELTNTFRNLEDPLIRERINNIREISNRLIEVLGGDSVKIDLGDEPVIVASESTLPT